MNQTLANQHLPSAAIDRIVNYLPDYIKAALLEKSTKLACSLKATIEIALSSFLDEEALSFEDCLLARRLKDPTPNIH